MKGIERQILGVVREMGKARPVSIARRICMQAATVETACQALVEDGYLLCRKETKTGGHIGGEPEPGHGPATAAGPDPSPIRTFPRVKTYVLSEAGRNAVSRAVSRGFIPVLKGGGW